MYMLPRSVLIRKYNALKSCYHIIRAVISSPADVIKLLTLSRQNQSQVEVQVLKIMTTQKTFVR